jgi:hypothetical protein
MKVLEVFDCVLEVIAVEGEGRGRDLVLEVN